MNDIYCIGNTHFDPVWLWTWDEAMAGIRSTFRSALDRMNENENFIYSFCCPPVFEWICEVDSGMFDEIQARVREGRWELSEGWWLQPDCNAPSGESLVRQGLYGQRYLMETFGLKSTAVFNSDSFGHGIGIPQILKKCGIDYYVFTRPDWTEMDIPGYLFRWQSPDGSEVLAYRISYGHPNDMTVATDGFNKMSDEVSYDLMLVYGVTNHGGAPTKKAIAHIDSLINEPPANCRYRFGTIKEYFQNQSGKALPELRDELQVKNFGVFSNEPEIKKNNLLGETALLNAEKVSVIAAVHGKRYPMEKIRASWKDLMFNQFHDIIGGASIKPAYFDARNLHGRMLQNTSEIIHSGLQYICKDIKMPGNLWNLVVFNLNASDYSGTIEAEIQWAWELDWYKDGLELTDTQGNLYPCQIITELSVFPAFRSRFVFAAGIPSMGYKTFSVRQTNKKSERVEPSKTVEHIENDRYKINICRETGAVSSIVCKRDGKTFKNVLTPYVRSDDGDTWAFNIDEYGERLEDFKYISSEILEHGQVETVIKTVSKFRSSIMEQYFTIYNEFDYIDYRFRVNWNEKHAVLKLNLKSAGERSQVAAGVPYASTKRPYDGREYPVNGWIDLGDITMLSDSVFAYDTNMKDYSVGLTVLRSAVYGDLRMDEALNEHTDYAFLSQGITEGKIRLVIRTDKDTGFHAPALAEAWKNLPIVVDEAYHSGMLPCEASYLRLEAESAVITAIKKSEDLSGDIVIRIFEYSGKSQQTKISGVFGKPFSVALNPHEIKTIRLNKNGSVEVDMLEESAGRV